MGFRQDNNSEEVAWLKSHHDELIAAGFPDFLLNDRRRWTYVLLHGDDPATGWRVSWLSPTQAEKLHKLLISRYEDESGYWVLRELSKRAAELD